MKRIILLCTVLVAWMNGTQAQTSLSFYNFNSVAQSNHLNPALPARQGFTLGLFETYNHVYVPGFQLNDLLNKGETVDATLDKFLGNSKYHLRDMQFTNNLDVLYMGLRIRKNYFSIGMQVNTDHSISLPKDVLALGYYGNGSGSSMFGKEIQISDLQAEVRASTAIHASYARQFGEKLTIGIRGKYHIGIYHGKTNRNQTTLLTDSGDASAIRMTATTDYEAQGAGISRFEELQAVSNNQALTGAQKATEQMNIGTRYLTSPVGSGFSFDLGVNYKASNKLNISASVLDLGSMNWKEGRTYSRKANFVYEGDRPEEFDPEKMDSTLQQLADSVTELFKPIQDSGSYTTSFNTRMFFGLNYQLYRSGNLGLVGYGEMWKGKFYPGFSVNFTQRIWKVLDLRLAYSNFRGNYNTIGGGFAMHLGPVTMYAMADNIMGMYDWHKTNYMNARFGMNINIGNRFDRDNDGVPDRKDQCKKIPGLMKMSGCPDKDGDGVPDHEDECVDVKGSKTAKGCPDQDGDGVQDSKDSCVTEKGLATLNGCPDQDGDGVQDSKDRCPTEKGTLETSGCPDKDGDGVADKEDACPDRSGPANLEGCPDQDGDGVADKDDECPAVPGLKQFNGCPDTDGDGIPNNKDSCLAQPGLPQFSGCPDTDGDNIPDYRDACPLEPGIPENGGCRKIEPNVVVLTVEEQKVINEAFSNLEFETGTDKISDKSLSSLEELATLLISKPMYKLEISGHTDNVGNAAKNLKLSQSRSNAVKSFLTKKGVPAAQMKAFGFGSKKPVADNKTPEGRQRNRRVEFKIVK